MDVTMERKHYQIIKTTSDLEGVITGKEIHCLCDSVERCIAELKRMYTAEWIGYPTIDKVLGNKILVVDTEDSMVVYSIREVSRIAKRPPRKYLLIPKLGRACDARPYTTYGEALEEKLRLERLTGNEYIIAK